MYTKFDIPKKMIMIRAHDYCISQYETALRVLEGDLSVPNHIGATAPDIAGSMATRDHFLYQQKLCLHNQIHTVVNTPPEEKVLETV